MRSLTWRYGIRILLFHLYFLQGVESEAKCSNDQGGESLFLDAPTTWPPPKTRTIRSLMQVLRGGVGGVGDNPGGEEGGGGSSWHPPMPLPPTPWQILWGEWHNRTTGEPIMNLGERIVWIAHNATMAIPKYGEVFSKGTMVVTFDRLLWIPRKFWRRPSWAVSFNQFAGHGWAEKGFPPQRLLAYPQPIHPVLSRRGALFRFFRNASTEARQADFNAITDKYALKDNDEDFPRVSKIRGDLWRPREKKIDALKLPMLRNDLMGFDVMFIRSSRNSTGKI